MAGTLLDHPLQSAPNAAQFTQALFDGSELQLRALPDTGHAPLGIGRQGEQFADFAEAETE